MGCTNPNKAWNSETVSKNGRTGISFKRPTYGSKEPDHYLPCGKCLDCKLDNSRQWAIRCMHEAKQHQENSFLTLTYDDNHLPDPPSISKEDLQKFLKRLRRKLPETEIRYFACGEYGEQTHRPHYHMLLFGYTPKDGIPASGSPKNNLYYSKFLKEIWGKGLVSYGEISYASARYVASYSTKKLKSTRQNYKAVIEETGEIVELLPEFGLMSRRPGIGYKHFKKFGSDYYPTDEVIFDGNKTKPPRYYDKKYKDQDEFKHEAMKVARIEKARKKPRLTEQQLKARARITKARLNLKSTEGNRI